VREETDARLVRRATRPTTPRAVRRLARVHVDRHHHRQHSAAPAALGRERWWQQPSLESARRAIVRRRGGGGRRRRGRRIAAKVRDAAHAAAAPATLIVLNAVYMQPKSGHWHVVQLLNLRAFVVILVSLRVNRRLHGVSNEKSET